MIKTNDGGRREFLRGSAASVLAASCLGWQIGPASAEDQVQRAWDVDRRRTDHLSLPPPDVRFSA